MHSDHGRYAMMQFRTGAIHILDLQQKCFSPMSNDIILFTKIEAFSFCRNNGVIWYREILSANMMQDITVQKLKFTRKMLMGITLRWHRLYFGLLQVNNDEFYQFSNRQRLSIPKTFGKWLLSASKTLNVFYDAFYGCRGDSLPTTKQFSPV